MNKREFFFAEAVSRFVQCLTAPLLFDFPPFYHLRSFCLRRLFDIGKGSRIEGSCRFVRANFQSPPPAAGHLKIGRRVMINHGVEIDYSGGVTIEDDVWISRNALIETHTHVLSRKPKSQWPISRSNLVIRKDAWIGANAVIMNSVNIIGEGAVVGAGAVVTKDVPDWAVAAGVPAKILKERI